MSEFEIGFKKPPKDWQFKPGQTGNPNGRPKKKPDPVAEVVQSVLDAPMQYREKGRTKTASRREVTLRLLVEKALKGDVGAAELLLKKRKRALRHGQSSIQRLVVTDWLPDYPSRSQAADPAVSPYEQSDDKSLDGGKAEG